MRKMILALATLLVVPLSAQATLQTSISVEQVSPTAPGTWTILFGNGTSLSSADISIDNNKHSFSITEFLPMTVSVVQPPGMSARIGIYRNGELVKTEMIPQFSFTPYPNETYRFVIQYSYSQLGDLGVTSTPSGVRFRMKGPSRTYAAKTPMTFKNLPAGKYSLVFSSTKTCLQPAPHTAVVKPGTRNTASILLACNVVEEEAVETRQLSKRAIVEAAKLREKKARGQRK